MQDLIERRAALTALCEDCLRKYEGICPHPDSRCVEFRTIKQIPAIDAEPVRHGRWKGWTTSRFTGKYKDYDEPEFKDYVYFTCSECYRKSAIQELYCPQCGARMDGGSDNG